MHSVRPHEVPVQPAVRRGHCVAEQLPLDAVLNADV